MKLSNKDILPCHQVAPYAPLELNKTDLCCGRQEMIGWIDESGPDYL